MALLIKKILRISRNVICNDLNTYLPDSDQESPRQHAVASVHRRIPPGRLGQHDVDSHQVFQLLDARQLWGREVEVGGRQPNDRLLLDRDEPGRHGVFPLTVCRPFCHGLCLCGGGGVKSWRLRDRLGGFLPLLLLGFSCCFRQDRNDLKLNKDCLKQDLNQWPPD